MRNLYLFFRRHYIYFLFLLLEVVSLSLFFNYNDFQNAAVYKLTTQLSGSVNSLFRNVSEYFTLGKTNQTLTQEIAQLQARMPEAFYKADTTAFFIGDTMYKTEYWYIAAKVISNSTNKRNNFLMINKGRMHGVENNMGVVIGNRIVGQVVGVSKHFSWVMSVLNKDSRISGKFKKNDQLVNIEWNGGSYRYGTVKEIPKHFEIKKGDTIITSGNSEIYPEGFLIGTIEDFTIAQDDNFNSATILFATDFNSLGYVEVVIDMMRKEKEDLKASFHTK
jgi:rod shape-determining protein MreC